jgi:tungstate transport system permease protein
MEGASFLVEACRGAFKLLFSGDPELFAAVSVSLQVAGVATLLCTLLGVPLGFLIATKRFWGRGFLLTLLNTLMAMPTVVVGLFVYAFLTRQSLLGPLELLFTRKAMIIGQVILALPIICALTSSAFISMDRAVRETALTLGASSARASITMLWEGRLGLVAAIAAGFGRLIGEVGVSMMLGGNIAYQTRNITTAIALETSKGEFAQAMALGIILMTAALAVNLLLRHLQGRREIR